MRFSSQMRHLSVKHAAWPPNIAHPMRETRYGQSLLYYVSLSATAALARQHSTCGLQLHLCEESRFRWQCGACRSNLRRSFEVLCRSPPHPRCKCEIGSPIETQPRLALRQSLALCPSVESRALAGVRIPALAHLDYQVLRVAHDLSAEILPRHRCGANGCTVTVPAKASAWRRQQPVDLLDLQKTDQHG